MTAAVDKLADDCLADLPESEWVGVRHVTRTRLYRLARAAYDLGAQAAPVVQVHHFDIEKHAESFNGGYEAAVTQGLADDPALAGDWLAAHDAEVARAAAKTALEEAANDFAESEGVEATALANDNVEAVQATEKWLLARAATYTTEEPS